MQEQQMAARASQGTHAKIQEYHSLAPHFWRGLIICLNLGLFLFGRAVDSALHLPHLPGTCIGGTTQGVPEKV